MAKCKTCGATPADAEFYDSIGTYCKEHWKARVRANRQERVDQYREYDRARANRADRVQARAAYSKTEAYRKSHNAASRLWDANNRDRRRAQIAVSNAVRDGRLKKQPCQCCGAEKVEGHHPDYSRPLYVVWLCVADHTLLHVEHDARVREGLYRN